LTSNDLVAFSVPPSLAKRVKRIVLDHNQLVGATFAHCAALQHVSLAHNRLDAVPDVTGCKKLTHLSLAHNNVRGEFERLARLSALESLDLSHNALAFDLASLYHLLVLPLKQCHSLKSLDLRSNPALAKNVDDLDAFLLSELPGLDTVNGRSVSKDDHKHADKLAKTKWADKLLRSFAIPDFIAPPLRLRSAESAKAHRRSATQQLPVYVLDAATADGRTSPGRASPGLRPASSGNVAAAGRRSRSGTGNTGVAAAASSSTLSAALLGSFFLDSLDSLEYPIHLDLSSDALDLESAELGKLLGDVLEELNLSNNRLSSAASLSRFSKLRRLYLSNNRLRSFTGTGLFALHTLDLSHNELRHMPPCGEARSLRVLRLAHNHIAQGFDELTRMRALQVLDFSYNELALTVPQMFSIVFAPLKLCALLEFVSFEGNPLVEKIEEFSSWCVVELPQLRWYATRFISESDRVAAQGLDKAGTWKEKGNAIGASSSASSASSSSVLAAAAAAAKQKEDRGIALDIPRALNLLAQVEADDMTLRPLETLADMVEPFVTARDGDRRFVHQGAPDDSVGSLLKTMHTTWSKSVPYRRELLQVLVALSGVSNQSLYTLCLQIINVILLSVDPAQVQERANVVTVIKQTYERLLSAQYSASVHACVTHNLGQLMPYNDDIAADCCDESLLVAALARTLAEREGRAARDALKLIIGLAWQALKAPLDGGKLKDILAQYHFATVVADVLQRKTVYNDTDIRQLGEVLGVVFQRFPALADELTRSATPMVIGLESAAHLQAHFDQAAASVAHEAAASHSAQGVQTLLMATPEQQELTGNWVALIGAALLSPTMAVALNKAGVGDALANIVSSCTTVNPPNLDLFKRVTPALSKLLHDVTGAAHTVSTRHPHLVVQCMRLLALKSEERDQLALRWRRLGATSEDSIEMLSSGIWDSLCEVVVWLTQHTPKDDDGASTQRRNVVLEQFVTERPDASVTRLVRATFGIEPKSTFFGRMFGGGGAKK
jgi:Leucine-rich repeat (LRR) protein